MSWLTEYSAGLCGRLGEREEQTLNTRQSLPCLRNNTSRWRRSPFWQFFVKSQIGWRGEKSLFYLHIQAGCHGRIEAAMSSMPLECWVFVFHIHLLVFRLFLLQGSPLFTEDSSSKKTTEISTLLHFEESDGLRGFLFTATNATWAIFSGNLEWAIFTNDRYQWRFLNGRLNVDAATRLQQMAKPRLPHGGQGT